MNTDKLVVIEIGDKTSLLKACDILHDSRFDLSKAKFDSKKGLWTAIFIREFFEDPALMLEHDVLLFTKLTFPMAECILELSSVKGCNVEDRADIGTYTFNECQPDGDGYRFFFCENMEMVFTFEGEPKGILRDIKLLDELGTYSVWRNPFRKRLTPASAYVRQQERR